MVTGLITRTLDQTRQFLCGLHGHDALLHFEQGRMSLRCTSCGYETPGWDLNAAPADPQVMEPKAGILRVPLVRERRVA